MKKCIFASLATVFSLLLLSHGLQAAEPTTLYDIRVGQHSGFTRVVLDSAGERPLKIGPAAADSLTIVYDRMRLERPSVVMFRDLTGAVTRVSRQQAGNQTLVTVTFRRPNTAVKSFYMTGKPSEKITYRLVLDFYPPGSAATGPGTMVAVAPQKAPEPAPMPVGTRPAKKPPVAAPVEKVQAKTQPEAAAPAVTGEEASEGKEEGEEISSAQSLFENFSGEISVIGRIRNDDAKDSLFTQYQDPKAVSGNFDVTYREEDRYAFSADGKNLGQDDLNLSFRGNWYGKIKGGITYDEIPHRFAFDARTLYTGVGSDFLSLNDGLQSDLQTAGLGTVAAATRLNTEFATASDSGDPEIKRKKLSMDVNFVAADPFSFRAEFSHVEQDGTRPFFGSFGLNSTAEIFEPIDNDTWNLKLIAEYAKDLLLLNATYYYQHFENNEDSLTFDNPFSTTDSLINGPGAGRIDLAPDNHYQNISLMGSYSNLPFRSRLSANAAWGWMTQDDDLLPFSSNSALVFPINYSDPANLPAGDADAKVNTTLFNTTLNSQPLDYMRLKANFRYYDYDNKTDRIILPDGYVESDSSPVLGALPNPIATLPSSYTNTKADLNLGFDVWTRTRLNLDYTYRRTDRDNREVDKQTDNIFGVAVDTNPVMWGDFRASYTRTITDIDDYDYNVYLQSGQDLNQLPALRKYTEADVTRDRVQLLANAYPVDPLVLSASFIYGRDDYTDSPYGLTDDHHYAFTLDGDYTLTDRLNLNAFYVYENYKNKQQARGEFDEDNDGISTVTDWRAEGEDKVNTFGGGITYAILPGRLDFKLSYAYSKVNGKIDFSIPNGSVPDFDTVDDTTLQTLDTNLKYNFWDSFFVTVGYRWEKFDYDDYNLEGFTNVPTDAGGNYNGAILSDTLWEDYAAHLFYTKLTYKF